MALATGIDFVREAISVKKWAFAADVIRLYAIYHDGGVYMDSDIYVQKRFDEFLEKRCVFFQEYHPGCNVSECIDDSGNRLKSMQRVRGMGIQAALFMSEPGNEFIKVLLEKYSQRHFILADGTFYMSLLAPDLYAREAERYGYKYLDVEQYLNDDLVVFPSIYVGSTIALRTASSFAVHCISHSWDEDFQKKKQWKDPVMIRVKVFIYNLYCRLVGKPYYKELKTFQEKLEAYPILS